MKIYTKTGDKGETALFDGTRLSKDDIRIESYGTVDELNSFIGVLMASLQDEALLAELSGIQKELFVIGSYLATPIEKSNLLKLKTFDQKPIDYLEQCIDRMDKELPALTAFILPSGSVAIANSHVCRTICRRAERRVVTLSSIENINLNLIVYLNRLSDYFFTVSRYIALKSQTAENLWMP